MRKKITFLMLLMALFVPWAVQAQTCTQTVPYMEDFESYTGTTYNASTNLEMPTCWTGFTTIPAYMPRVVSGTGTYVYYHGSKGFAMTGGSASTYGMNKYVLLPPMDEPLNQLQLTFWMCTESSGASYGTLHVGYVTSDDTSTFVSITSISSSTATYHSGNGQQAPGVGLEVELILSQLPSNATRLAFKWEHSNSSFHTCCIDDIVVNYPPTCPHVENLSVAPSSDEAVVSWTEIGSANDWEIALTQGSTTTLEYANTNPYTITNLTPFTNYSVSVRAICSVDDTSTPRSMDFRTACAAYPADSLPYVYGVEDASATGAAATFNPCWGRHQYGITTKYPYPSDSYKHSGTYSLYFNSTTGSVRTWATLPLFESPVNTLQISFWLLKTSANYGHLAVGVMSDPTNIETFDTIALLQPSALTEWEYFEVPLMAYTGAGNYITLLATSSANSYVYVDDITVDLPPACPRPTVITSSNVTPTSADVTWHDNGSTTTEFIVEYGPQGFEWGLGTTAVVSDTMISLTGLRMGQTYDVYVVAVCGSDTSTIGIGSFTTGCDVITENDLPYVEDFEDYESGSSYSISPCWTKGTNGSTAYPYPYATNAINGSRSLYFYGYYPSSATAAHIYSYAVLPPIDENMSMSDLMVTFVARRYTTATTYYNSTILVGIADTNAFSSDTELGTLVEWIDTLDYTSTAASSIHDAEISFENYTGTGRYLVFYAPVPPLSGSNTYAYNYIYIDDITLRRIPTCFWPEEVVVTALGSDEVSLAWTPDSRTTSPSGWSVEYGLHGFVPGSENGTVLSLSDTSVTLEDLTPNTEYDFYVMADCGSEMSDPTAITFRTACVPLDSLPYVQDFETEADGGTQSVVFPSCMTRLNNGTTYFGYPYVSSTSSYNHTPGGTKGLYWYGSTTTSTYGDYQYVVLPAVNTTLHPVNTLQLSFWARATSASYYPVFYVGVMTNPNDPNTFVQLQTINVEGTVYTKYTTALGNYTGDGAYVAIKALRPSTAWYATVDDIVLDVMPSCPPVVDLDATTTVGSAMLTWNTPNGYNGTPNGYVVTYDSINATGTPTSITVTEPYVVLTGLVPGTAYKAYVHADCGNTDGVGSADSVIFDTKELDCLQLDPSTTDTVIFTNSTSGQSGCIAYSSYGNTVYQTIYTAAELTAAGLAAGPITGIDLGFTASSSYAKEFSIYIGNTSTTSISDANMENPNMQQHVYGPAPHPTNTSGWQHYDFTTPFNWDGTSSIIITTFMNQPAGVTQTSSSGLSGYYVSASNKARYRYRDSNPFTLTDYNSGTASSTYSYRASIHFYSAECMVQASCADPVVAVTDVQTNEVTLSWLPGYNESAWDVEYRVSGTTTWTTALSATSATSYTVTGLTDATEYEFRVGFSCGDGTEYDATVSAKTLCLPAVLPYVENFDGLTTGTATTNLTVMPDCWDWVLTGTSTYQAPSYYPGVYYSTSYSNSGNYCLRLYGRGYFMLPPMPTTIDSLMLSMNVYITSSSYGLVVGAMEGDVFVPIDTLDLATSTHNDIILLLSNYHGTSRTLAFHNTYSSNSYSYIYIDDLRVEYVPSCQRPFMVEVSAYDDSSATIVWDSLGIGYDVVVSTTSVDPDTVSNIYTLTDNQLTINDLLPNTVYYVYVRTNCGLTYSDWSNEIDFRTACAPLALPYSEDFESYGSGASYGISPCWTKNVYGTTTAYPYPYSTNAVTGSRSLYFYAYQPSSATTTPYHCYAALPMFQDSVKNLSLSMNVRRYSTTTDYYTTRLIIGVMTNPDDIATFFPMDTLDLKEEAGGTIHGYEYNFNNYTGDGRFIAIYNAVPPLYGTATYCYSYAYVDDIVVDYIASCQRPSGVTFSNITQNSATVHWNASQYAAPNFEVEYGLQGFALGSGTTLTVTGDSVDLTGLMASSSYDVYVRALCSTTDASNWSFVKHFATECGAIVLPMFVDFEGMSTGTSAPLPTCWTRTNNATGTYNYYPYVYSSTTYSHSGSNSLYFYNSTTSGYPSDQMIVFPPIDVTANSIDAIELNFWARAGSYNNRKLILGVMTNPNAMSTFVATDTVVTSTVLREYTMNTSSYTGTGTYVALRMTSDTTISYSIYVDDITLQAMSPCPRAYNLTAYNGTDTSVTLEWSDTINSSSWVIEYGVLGSNTTTTVTTSSNPFVLTGLTPGTNYHYHVAPYCPNGVQADWSLQWHNFGTALNAAAMPYSYDFEDAAEWANWQTSSSSNVNWYRGNVATGNTTNALYLSADNGLTHSWNMNIRTNAVAYRDIDFGDTVGSYQIDFDAYMGGTISANYDGIAVVVTDPAIYVEDQDVNITSPWGNVNDVSIGTVRRDTSWGHYTMYFDGVSGVKRIAFYHFNQATGANYPFIDAASAIDNVVVSLQDCERPYNLVASNATINSVTLNWGGDPTALYQVAYRVQGAAASTNVYTMVNGTTTTLSGLPAATDYYWWVRKICTLTATDTNVSGFSLNGVFTTLCGVISVADTLFDDFESYTPVLYSNATDGELPNCWDSWNTSTAAAPVYPHVTDSGTYSYCNSGRQAITMTAGSPTGNYGSHSYLRLIDIAEPTNSLTVAFWMCTESSSNGYLEIGYLTGPDYENDFVAVSTITASTATYHSGNGHQAAGHGVFDTVSFENVPAGNYPICFHWSYTTSFYSVCLDDIAVWSSNSCSAPTVTVTNVSYSSATVNVSGSGMSFDLAYGTDPANLSNTMTSTTNTFNLTGLTPSTNYFYSVTQTCDSGAVSIAATGHFITDSLPCFEPTDVTLVGTTFNSVEISWTSNGNATSWVISVSGAGATRYDTATTNPYNVTNLYSNQPYTFMVMSICGNGAIESGWSEPLSVTTDVCTKVSGVSVNDITATSATVSWNAAPGSIGYKVYYGDPDFYDSEASTEDIASGTTSFTITGLNPETPYEVYVRNRCTETLYSEVTNEDRVGFTTGSSTEGIYDVESGTLTLFPNPASSQVTLTVSGMDGMVEVEIVDMNGRVAGNWQLTAGQMTLDVSNLTQGAYFVRVTGEHQTAVRKLIVK